MMNVSRKLSLVMAIFSVCLVVSGCGGADKGDRPDLGLVTGVISMDDAPLAGANVTFSPDNGRPSIGTTDASGKYELTYIRDDKGAKLGHHKVSITTAVEEPEAGGGDIPEDAIEPIEETIPAKYNVKTTLEATVKEGENTFDFKLESK